MNVNELELSEIGNWPAPAKAIFIALVCVLVTVGMYFAVIEQQWDELNRVQQEEQKLKKTFEAKQRLAANLEAYREQMEQLEMTLAQFLKQLPTEDETAGLLDDINFVGTASGLDFQVIEWSAPQEKEFYIELPINIQVSGDYHQLGTFVSDVAALPRIVTLHDFNIKTVSEGRLSMSLQAKTYKYKEGSADVKKG
ncbi:type 4a pilus biogenesis protein PilO [Gallaecimonas sp. GXIMD4217]|uniref:type 4a pilus biogenesis protein PilO n=1 Tax=Gallaecimonas sp. GXIMD4217 TaxID=3131927 RepID=UPI00311B1A64